MTILVTGGCGFLGHHVVDHILTSSEDSVVTLDRLDYSSTLGRLNDLRSFHRHRDRVKIVFHDLRAEINDSVRSAIGKIDAIFHLAANSHVDRSIANPLEAAADNVIGTVNMLEYARKVENLKLFLMFNTDEVFGPAPDGYFHKENDPHMPSNPYSASKSSAGQFAQAYITTFGLPIIQSFTMNIFGERQHSDKLIPKTIKNLLAGKPMDIHCKLADGKPVEIGSRVWIYAGSVADALTHLLHKGLVGQRYNIIGFEEFSNLEVAQKVADLMHKKLEVNYVDFHLVRPGHDRRYALDGTKLKKLGWRPYFYFDDGLKRTVEFTLKNQQWLA